MLTTAICMQCAWMSVRKCAMEPKPIPYHDLLRALKPDDETSRQGCPICQLVTESVARYLDDLIFFSAVKPDTRAEIRAARGFCNEHASQLTQLMGKGLGVALIHEDVIDTVMEGLQSAVPRPTRAWLNWPAGGTPTKTRARRAAARAVQALAPQGSCLACQHQLLVEESYLAARSGAISTTRRSRQHGAPPPACACCICARHSWAHPMRMRCGG